MLELTPPYLVRFFLGPDRFAGIMALGGIVCCGNSGTKPTDKYRVSGTVTFDGQQIPKVYLVLRPADETRAADGGKIVDGRFEFLANPGAKNVVIDASRPEPIDPEMESPRPIFYIPSRYNTKTELTAEVKTEGENRFEFVLMAEGGRK